MPHIIHHGDYAEVVTDSGQRLFCSATVASAQSIWKADGATLGRPDLVSAEPLPVACAQAEPHISDRVRETLLHLGFGTDDGTTYRRTVEGASEAGSLSDGRRTVTLAIDVTGRWLESLDGWGKAQADVDLRDYSEPLLAIWQLCPALRPVERIVLVRGNRVALSMATIAATRRWYADNAIACIAEAQAFVDTDGRDGVRVNDLPSYVEWQRQCAAKSLSGDHDNTFAFLQRAVASQTNECVPLLAH